MQIQNKCNDVHLKKYQVGITSSSSSLRNKQSLPPSVIPAQFVLTIRLIFGDFEHQVPLNTQWLFYFSYFSFLLV